MAPILLCNELHSKGVRTGETRLTEDPRAGAGGGNRRREPGTAGRRGDAPDGRGGRVPSGNRGPHGET
ncbi:hypothetical protein GCM10022244_02030 [Streptomyces gulbargensis]|uniref:Uncharacterized protein n=1 Tax=Streptomyces gulbargensis TaxID=364901 RepID=A0ABP7L7Y8_9ACTN